MKKFTCSVLLIVCSTLCAVRGLAAPGQPATNAVPLYFTWQNPAGASNLTWRVYSSTSLSVPTNQWPLFAVLNNPTLVGSQLTWTNPVGTAPGTYFFTMTLSNFWIGETFFSDAAASGGSPGIIPSPVQNFSVGVAQTLK